MILFLLSKFFKKRPVRHNVKRYQRFWLIAASLIFVGIVLILVGQDRYGLICVLMGGAVLMTSLSFWFRRII
jgi:hypothetical protein